jgi:flagellar P-ring protein FlgI
MNRNLLVSVILTMALLLPPAAEGASRLKELASLEGARDNQLLGYGLVVGLAGTGDRRQTVFSAQSLTNLLERMGVSVSPSAIQVRNVATAMITATLPPFAQPGSRIDVTVAAIGDASNLQGGLLILSSLKGVDGQVYAMAQGPVVTGGFVAGQSGNKQTVNHPTVGRVPEGALVERKAPSELNGQQLKFLLHQADFTTSARIAEAVNLRFGGPKAKIAKAENSALVTVNIPAEYAPRSVEFLAELERLTVETDRQARIVVNERTGTIVMGKEVRISPVAIMHGNLTVEVQTSFSVSQPQALSSGTTEVVPQIQVGIKEEKTRNLVLQQGATVEELVRALSSIGSTPRDVIAILQNLRSAGALEAELVVI